jgi:hypothetical protein
LPAGSARVNAHREGFFPCRLWIPMMTCFSMKPFRAQESAPDMARRAAKTVCPDAGVSDGREERVPSE